MTVTVGRRRALYPRNETTLDITNLVTVTRPLKLNLRCLGCNTRRFCAGAHVLQRHDLLALEAVEFSTEQDNKEQFFPSKFVGKSEVAPNGLPYHPTIYLHCHSHLITCGVR